MNLSEQQRDAFLEAVWEFYGSHGRDLPWRRPEPDGSFDPYKIMVSELMLQQTQVRRVVPKYHEFLGLFPTVQSLARAELGDVLRVWQGLGYNRRAKFLWQAAQAVARLGRFPDTPTELTKLPGVGANTAGAILAYAYNRPAVFIETNIRTVYIHHFFPGRTDVSDKEIASLMVQTLFAEEGKEQPREFYWALMDYGSYLKTTAGNASKASKHYTKQSKFHGSRRQVRGAIIRALSGESRGLHALQEVVGDERLVGILADLMAEGLVREHNGMYAL